MVQVLIRTDNDRQLIATPLQPNQTVKDLKAYVAQKLGVSTPDDLKVLLGGEECSDTQQIGTDDSSRSSSSSLTVQSAGLQVFPNNWFDSPYAKTYAKVLDITWAPVRQADYTVGWIWVAAAAAALAAVNLVLGA